jgi:hypothetical protein
VPQARVRIQVVDNAKKKALYLMPGISNVDVTVRLFDTVGTLEAMLTSWNWSWTGEAQLAINACWGASRVERPHWRFRRSERIPGCARCTERPVIDRAIFLSAERPELAGTWSTRVAAVWQANSTDRSEAPRPTSRRPAAYPKATAVTVCLFQ